MEMGEQSFSVDPERRQRINGMLKKIQAGEVKVVDVAEAEKERQAKVDEDKQQQIWTKIQNMQQSVSNRPNRPRKSN